MVELSVLFNYDRQCNELSELQAERDRRLAEEIMIAFKRSGKRRLHSVF